MRIHRVVSTCKSGKQTVSCNRAQREKNSSRFRLHFLQRAGRFAEMRLNNRRIYICVTVDRTGKNGNAEITELSTTQILAILLGTAHFSRLASTSRTFGANATEQSTTITAACPAMAKRGWRRRKSPSYRPKFQCSSLFENRETVTMIGETARKQHHITAMYFAFMQSMGGQSNGKQSAHSRKANRSSCQATHSDLLPSMPITACAGSQGKTSLKFSKNRSGRGSAESVTGTRLRTPKSNPDARCYCSCNLPARGRCGGRRSW